MDLNLRGRSVLVTGGSRGIGFGIAESFAVEGANLHLASRSESDLAKAQESLVTKYGVDVNTYALDLGQSSDMTRLVNECEDIDVLVNNAGAVPSGDLESIDEATWRKGWELKVFGYINLTRAYYGRMCERGHGVIINITGIASDRLDADYVAGSTGNAALMAFTRTVGSRSLRHGVRVIAVNPGAVETDRTVKWRKSKAETEFGDPNRWREYFKDLPLGRAAQLNEVADVVVFLASDRASYISGTAITVDGGHTHSAGL